MRIVQENCDKKYIFATRTFPYNNMKKILSFTFLLLALPVYLQAQISEGGEPVSFSQYFEQVIDKSSPLPTLAITPIDLEEVKRETKQGIKLNLISRTIWVNLNPENSGYWDELSNGDRVWRLHIKSAGAVALYPFYDHFWLPQGAKLFIYSPNKKQIRGAFTHNTNPRTREFATDGVDGDEMIFEVFEPKAVRGQTKLNINRLEYGVKAEIKDLPSKDVSKPELRIGFNSSNAACQINVNCSLGDNWRQQQRSIVQIRMPVTGGLAVCTGSLIQNDQGKPYVLCAWHCQDGITTASPYSTWNFGFNWEASGCTTPSSDPGNRVSIIGCTEKVKSSDSDVLLLELNSTPPSNYNVYYNGWDRTGTTPTSVVGIHHPAGDIKKISVNTGTTSVNANGITFSGGNTPLVIPAGNLWTFSWTSGDTEGGSSGSPLFNQNGHTIGQLTGGSGDCNNNNFSAYGRMSSSWGALQPFLSSTDASRQTMNGYDPNVASSNAGVTTITSTVSPCNLNSNVPVKFTVRNHGQSAQTDLPYSWTLTHSTATTQSGNGTVTSLAGLTTTDITVNVDMSLTGTYTFTARTNLTGDANPGDDSKVTTFTNTTPTTSSSNITFSEPDAIFKMTINYTKGNGENRLVLLKEGGSFTNDDLPVQGQSYTANITFGFGSKIGNAYVVYKGSASSAPILDGLTVGANYHVAIVEYSCAIPKYFLGSGVAYASKVFTANERDLLAEGIKVFPNPAQANKEIRVELSNLFDNNSSWELQNGQGKTLQKGAFEKRSEGLATRINLRKQSAGIYFVRIKSGNEVVVKKIVVQ